MRLVLWNLDRDRWIIFIGLGFGFSSVVLDLRKRQMFKKCWRLFYQFSTLYHVRQNISWEDNKSKILDGKFKRNFKRKNVFTLPFLFVIQ